MQLRFLLQSLWHYRNARLGVVAGTIVGATVLLGALFAGDSVSAALKRLAGLRVGQAEYALSAGDRFVTEALAETIEKELGLDAAPALMLRASASRSELQLLAPHAQALGVDERFWEFAPVSESEGLLGKPGTVAINERLAERLELQPGDSFVFRMEKPGLLSRDAPLSGSKDNTLGIRATVSAIVSDDQFGRFSLQANQIAPFTIFAPIKWMQEQIEYENRANLFLIKRGDSTKGLDSAGEIMTALSPLMTLEDYGLSIVDVPLANALEIRSERVFLDTTMVDSIKRRLPQVEEVITYMANGLESKGNETPYSMVTALEGRSAPFLGGDLEADEAVITQWLADDLQVGAGDSLNIRYYVIDEAGELAEETATFGIKSVVPLEGLAADSLWMPDFPGVADAEDSSDWEPGMPLDLTRIRDKDEDYWDDYHGAPKAYISLGVGVERWENRWGKSTALRIGALAGGSEELESSVKDALDPALVGIRTLSLRDSALKSANSPVDIGGLFIGMSFFLIIAALSLVGMLFSFSMQQMNRENALLSALGIGEKRIYRWRLAESLLLVALGSVIALPLAVGYTVGILRFLETIWSENSGGGLFGFYWSWPTAAGGILGNLVLALAVIWMVLRKQSRTQASFRLQQGAAEDEGDGNGSEGRWAKLCGFGGLAVGSLMLGVSLLGLLPLQIGYFLVGFCWLVGGLGICSRRFRDGQGSRETLVTPEQMGRLNNGRRPMRSLTVVGTLACGVFLVVSVAAFRKERDTSGNDPKNGYGGYTYWVETSIPLSDANEISGADNVFETGDAGSVLPLRVGEGDDASCFNLNYTTNPRLLALESETLAAREAFTFHSVKEGLDEEDGWRLLKRAEPNGPIPAFIDSATMQWALKKKLGDRLTYLDAWGQPFEVELVGALHDTVFQGSLLIDEALFLERFPQHEGYRVFMVDAWGDDLSAKRAEMEFALGTRGGQVELSSDRLQSFHEVENTYIAIFHVLGGLGVILGSAGLGVVVARNLSERRHEFALLDAIGVPDDARKKIVFSELRSLVGWGMGIGLGAALVSIIPSMQHLGVAAPVVNLLILAVLIALNAAFWSYLGYRRNLPELSDLQREFNS